MTRISDLRRKVTAEQKKSADFALLALMNKGFEAEDLDQLVLRMAEQLGESAPCEAGGRDHQIDEEISAAEELNMTSLKAQLLALAAFHQTADRFIEALELDLMIELPAP